MFRSLFDGHALIDLPVISMLFFFAVFAAVLLRVILKGEAHYDEVARLPLDDTTAPPARGRETAGRTPNDEIREVIR